MLDDATVSAVESLLRRLRVEEHWQIAPDQLIAANNVLLALLDDPSVTTPSELAAWIAPIVCTSPAEQRDFHERMSALRIHAPALPEQKTALEHTPPATATRHRLVAAATFLIVLALGLLVYAVWVTNFATPEPVTPPKTKLTPQQKPMARGGAVVVPPHVAQAAPVVQPRELSWWQDRTTQLVTGISFAALLLGIAAALLLLRLRRQYELTKVFEREGDVDHHYPQVGSRFFLPGEFRRTSQLLQRRRYESAAEIDVRRSVAATARRGGYFMPVYATRGRLPEYVVLIDRASADDQQALLYEQFIAQLRNDDVLVDVYEFRRDPRVCWRKGKRRDPVHFAELAVRHGDDALLVFSDAAIFTDPVRRGVAGWLETFRTSFRTVALFTSRPPSQWDEREHLIADEGIHVLPASSAGLSAFAATLESEKPPTAEWAEALPGLPPILTQQPHVWIANRRPEPEMLEELLVELEATLGADGLRWLAACAIYPAVNWFVTLYLGAALRLPDLDRNLLALVRLPWFRRGTMPEWLRTELIWTLTRKEESEARVALRELFDKSIRAKHGVTSLHLVTFRDLHNAAPAGSPIRDYVLARFMEGYLPRRNDFSLPAIFESIATSLRGRGVRREPFLALLAAYVPIVSLWIAYGKGSPAVRWHARHGTILSAMGAVWLFLVALLASDWQMTLFFFGAPWLPLPVLAFYRARRGERLRVPIAAQFADGVPPKPNDARLWRIRFAYALGLPGLFYAWSRDPELRWHGRNAFSGFAVAVILWLLAVPLLSLIIGLGYAVFGVLGAARASRDKYLRIPLVSAWAGRLPSLPPAPFPQSRAVWYVIFPLILSSALVPSFSTVYSPSGSPLLAALLVVLTTFICDRVYAHRIGLFVGVATITFAAYLVAEDGLDVSVALLGESALVLVIACAIALLPRVASTPFSIVRLSAIFLGLRLCGIIATYELSSVYQGCALIAVAVFMLACALRLVFMTLTPASATYVPSRGRRTYWAILFPAAVFAFATSRMATRSFYELAVSVSRFNHTSYLLTTLFVLVLATWFFRRLEKPSLRIVAALMLIAASIPVAIAFSLFDLNTWLPVLAVATAEISAFLIRTAVWAASLHASTRYRATTVAGVHLATLFVTEFSNMIGSENPIGTALMGLVGAGVVMKVLTSVARPREEVPPAVAAA